MSAPPGIAEYAAIGDGRTVALVSRSGSIDWLCLPDLDSPSAFGRLLDPGAGSFRVGPSAPATSRRRYLPDTNVLETTHATATGTLRVTEALTLPDERLPPQRELVRLVEAIDGEVEVAWRFEPRFGYGCERTRLERRRGALVATAGANAVALLLHPHAACELERGSATGRVTLPAGERLVLTLACAHGEPLVLPPAGDALRRLRSTCEHWRRWAAERAYDGPWREQVIRSALALKLLVYAPSGAIAAAPTTSLPEFLGGDRNFDYRFCWVRDSAFAMSALLRLGCVREARAFLSWLMHATQLTRPELRVLYALDGGGAGRERTLPLEGYRGSRPVRAGNAAATQLQLDAYGDLLDAACLYEDSEGLDAEVGRRLADVADHVCSVWREPDSGIWELRERVDHFTEGKMKCAIALERACALAARGSAPDRHAASWRREADAIRRFVDEECWSEELGSYVQAAGSRELDASVLLAAQSGYSPAGDERLSSSIDAVRERLGDGPLLHRNDDLRGREGAFVACSFWLVGALAHVGRVEEAGETMEALLARTNDVGLLAEEIDPASGEFLGNFPQGLSHLSLVEAAGRFAEEQRAA